MRHEDLTITLTGGSPPPEEEEENLIEKNDVVSVSSLLAKNNALKQLLELEKRRCKAERERTAAAIKLCEHLSRERFDLFERAKVAEETAARSSGARKEAEKHACELEEKAKKATDENNDLTQMRLREMKHVICVQQREILRLRERVTDGESLTEPCGGSSGTLASLADAVEDGIALSNAEARYRKRLRDLEAKHEEDMLAQTDRARSAEEQLRVLEEQLTSSRELNEALVQRLQRLAGEKERAVSEAEALREEKLDGWV